MKILSALIKNCNIIESKGPLDIKIEGIAYDSRNVKTGFAFFALEGIHADGRKFISDALARGASAVFTYTTVEEQSGYHAEKYPDYPDFSDKEAAFFIVDNTRNAMSAFSSSFYENPSEKLKITGVTGTDGKSSTVSFIYQLLKLAGKRSGFISTVDYDSKGITEKNPYRQSTPESPEIMSILSEMVYNNVEYAVVEATSHGLSEKTARLNNIKFKAGVLTNISHEHLEFHGTMENYIKDKSNLFKKAEDFCILNINEPNSGKFLQAASVPVFTYGIENRSADISAFNIASGSNNSEFDLVYGNIFKRCILSVPGKFNIENILAALLTVHKLTGIEITQLTEYTGSIKPVRGRMESVDAGQPFSLIVDYAHTPGAFKKLLPAIRKTAEKRLIAVFGSAGERDTAKRKIQGEIASAYCDIIILTDEDPRGETPDKIIDDIAEGINPEFNRNNIYRIPDRKSAIRKAVETAHPGDTVILLGKGHESSIIYEKSSIQWDEKNTAIDILKEFGFKISD